MTYPNLFYFCCLLTYFNVCEYSDTVRLMFVPDVSTKKSVMKQKLIQYISLLIGLMFSAIPAWSATVICGKAPSYAGKTLSVRAYSDQILYDEDELGEAQVDAQGNFRFELPVTTTMQVFIPMPTCRGFIYVEPNQTYTVSLPQFEDRSIAQKLSPYFTPKDYLLTIVDMKRGDFNYQMMEFDDGFDFYSMKHLTYGAKPDSIKKSISQMRQIFNDLNKPFQKEFKEYRYILLTNMAATTSARLDSVILQLNQMGVNEDNPAFWDAFNNIFADFVENTRDTEDFEVFKRIISVGDAKMLLAMLKERYGITNPALREYAAVRIVSDLATKDEFERSKLIAILLALKPLFTIENCKAVLVGETNKLCVNYIGTEAPDFEGVNTAGKTVRLSNLKGKYVYLNFCNTHIDKTVRDIQVLQRFSESFNKNLVVLNVFLYDEMQDVKRVALPFSKSKMTFLTVPQPDLLRQYYDVKAIPSYLILDQKGNIMMTKGAEPNDELRLFLQNAFK